MTIHARFGRDRARAVVRVVGVVTIMVVLAVLPSAPPASAAASNSRQQSNSAEGAEQRQAAEELLAELSATAGRVELDEAALDPALGPPPWTSMADGRDPLTVEAWVELSRRQGNNKVTRQAAGRAMAATDVTDIEPPGVVGLNDSPATGQPIVGFGPDANDTVTISGALNGALPQWDCPAIEPNEVIAQSSPRFFEVEDDLSLCGGVIGDGPNAATVGDVDVFTIGFVEAGARVWVRIFPLEGELSAAIYDSSGTLIAERTTDEPRTWIHTSDGDSYYAVVAGSGALPANATVPTNQGPTSIGAYEFEMGFLDPLPVNALNLAANDDPCPPDGEDNGSIGTAVAVGDINCIFTLGDGPYASTSGDVDMYSVDVTVGDMLAVRVGTGREPDTTLTIYNEFGNIIAYDDDTFSIDPAINLAITNTQTLYIAVGAYGTTQSNPFSSASGSGAAATGDYRLIVTVGPDVAEPDLGFDRDVYLIDLEPGDVFRAGVAGGVGTVAILDPRGMLLQKSDTTLSRRYPDESPLRHDYALGIDHVAAVAGTFSVILTEGYGDYEGEFKVVRSGLGGGPGTAQQIVFVDFDGATVDPANFGQPQLDPTFLTPMVSWLPNLGLDASDENTAIDEILDVFEAKVSDYLRHFGGNGNRDLTGEGGDFDIEIRNSRDHADPWGQPNVTRVVVGGSTSQLNFSSGIVGIAESVDPGNLDQSETALVLLDRITNPLPIGGAPISNYSIAPGQTVLAFFGRAVGTLAAHELGHTLGNYHTAVFNESTTIGVMDRGGRYHSLYGLGKDFIFGTGDDTVTNFHQDVYEPGENFSGTQDTRVRSAFGMSTGQTDVLREFGDASCDGDLDSDDALVILDYLVGLREGSTCAASQGPIDLSMADVNGNGTVDLADAILIDALTQGD